MTQKAKDTEEANAALIAAAPELLEVLEKFKEWSPEMENDDPISGCDMVDWFCVTYAQAMSAIAKATA